MTDKLTTSLPGFRERNCTMSIVLDIRTNRRNIKEYPLKARFTIDRQSYYYPLGGSYTRVTFSEICNTKKSKSEKYEIKRTWLDFIEKYKQILLNLNPGQELTLNDVRIAVAGRASKPKKKGDDGKVYEISLIGIWKEIIERLKTENNGARYSTGESYESALKSFLKIMWNHPIKGFNITIDDLNTWNMGMKNGVMDKNGKLVGKISDTTRGIYLRTCRAVWNECRSRGYLTHMEYPFSNTKKGAIAIPRSATRRASYLNVDKMTQLYQVWVEKRYPDLWKKDYTEKVHYSLGLFLVQYLCNGFNLADAGELTYDRYYFDTERKAFKFHRRKTRGRSVGGSEVIIPIIEPLQRILDEIAAPPMLGDRVFPHILEGAENEAMVRTRVSEENSNVKHRLIRVCEEVLHWEVRPSGTWARHSFATNLALAGVEQRYISESMGHSISQSVTELYIASYPLDMQLAYNSKLLNLGGKESDIDNMSEEQLKAIVKRLLFK